MPQFFAPKGTTCGVLKYDDYEAYRGMPYGGEGSLVESLQHLRTRPEFRTTPFLKINLCPSHKKRLQYNEENLFAYADEAFE